MRVLLINSNRKGDLLAAPPLGLCYVASAAEKAGHTVKVVDLCFAPADVEPTIRKALAEFQPEVVGVSIRNIDNVNMLHPVSFLPGVVSLVRTIRGYSRATLVIGGSGAGLMPENVLRRLGADYIVVSDGEEAFVRLLEALDHGETAPEIPGVGFVAGRTFELTRPRLISFDAGRPDLGRWINMSPYMKIGGSYNVQAKRGCRQKCIYCTYNQALEGARLRMRPITEVVDEIEEALGNYSPKSFEFVDSVFNDPVDYAGALLEEICRRPWKVEFTAMGVHPRGLNREFLSLMWRAGFRSFMITPESASDIMLASYRKGFTKDEVVHSAEAINKTDFHAWWFFMAGGPDETNDTLEESLNFARRYLQKGSRSAAHTAHYFTGVRVYPGTRLWDIARAEGFMADDADPLENIWYLSEKLDIDKAVDQMLRAASEIPEVYLGFDERVLVFSRIAAAVFSFLGMPGPYWRYFRTANRFGLAVGLRFIFRPSDIGAMVRTALQKQGYSGPHLDVRR